MNLHLPRRLCGDVHAALAREWLVTNGIGGFASGTVAGGLTRRYHGLLVAALQPPLGRQLLVTKLDETALIGRQRYQLYTNVWKSGIEEPSGCRHLARFDLQHGVPTWTYACGPAVLTKRVWMEAGRNATFIRYDLAPGAQPIDLQCRLLVNDRHYHHMTLGGRTAFHVHTDDADMIIRSGHAPMPTHVRCAADVHWSVDYTWCHDFDLAIEAQRGFDHLESHLVVGACTVHLEPGEHVTFIASTSVDRDVDPEGALERCQARAAERLDTWSRHVGRAARTTPPAYRQLVLAADQFIVTRPLPGEPDGHTVMAGYPWFTDWGRDTMIALPGLTLVTGRFDVARQILRTWARYVRHGLIPNRFPDEGHEPEYHTADATLWYLWAIDQYVRATGDTDTLAELFPVMAAIVAAHRQGTRHNIRVGDDGLVYAGEEGINLTWMDAKIGSRVITPRIGKPVELSALWYDALCNMARMADLIGCPDQTYMRLAQRTRNSFYRFWNPGRDCCFDVIDGPEGNDARLRPNQIFAASLTHSPLAREQREAIVRVVGDQLLTSFGLRSLGPHERGYHKHYAGNPVKRDEAYHQGTSWTWLLGPLVIAEYRLHKDAALARQRLAPMCGQLYTNGLGTLGEIHDAEPPHAAHGCCAQAWSVAEILRAWHVTQAHA
jgi:predicted glycogen debranching enzyme